MAKYTTELRSICEVYAGYNEEQGYNNVNDVIEKASLTLTSLSMMKHIGLFLKQRLLNISILGKFAVKQRQGGNCFLMNALT